MRKKLVNKKVRLCFAPPIFLTYINYLNLTICTLMNATKSKRKDDNQCSEGVHSLIVPDEIPTILSVIYSNIPILKKGTDSRVGWGFRLGDRADFQVLVELGPQTYTQPLANQEDKNTNNKRNTIDSLSNTLYAQRQKDKQNKQKEKQITKTDGGKWLESWSKSVKQRNQVNKQELPPGAKPGIAVGEVDAKSVIPDDATLKLAEMYQEQEVKEETRDDSVAKLTDLYHAEPIEESESVTESSTSQSS